MEKQKQKTYYQQILKIFYKEIFQEERKHSSRKAEEHKNQLQKNDVFSKYNNDNI